MKQSLQIYLLLAGIFIAQLVYSQNNQLTYEPFDYLPSTALHGQGGGRGWQGAWQVQNNSVALPGYAIAAGTSSLPVNNLQVQGSYATAGINYLNAGRSLDLGYFTNYLNTSGLIGANGTTLYISVLLRKEEANDNASLISFNANTSPYDNTNQKISVGYGGSSCNTSNIRYWSLGIGSNWYQSSVPVATGATALLVLKINFGATNTVNLFVEPNISSGAEPASASVSQTTTIDLGFKNIRYYGGGSTTNQSSLDEIRLGSSFLAASPTPTNGGQVTNGGPVNGNSAWNLTGNSGTDASTFIGTQDAQPLVFKTNGQTRAIISGNGNTTILGNTFLNTVTSNTINATAINFPDGSITSSQSASMWVKTGTGFTHNGPLTITGAPNTAFPMITVLKGGINTHSLWVENIITARQNIISLGSMSALGNMSVGTPDLSERLVVGGRVKADGLIFRDGSILTTAGTSNAFTLSTSGSNTFLTTNKAMNIGGTLKLGTGSMFLNGKGVVPTQGTAGIDEIFTGDPSQPLYLQYSNNGNTIINQNGGFVGMGMSPVAGGALLQVNGDIKASSIILPGGTITGTSGWNAGAYQLTQWLCVLIDYGPFHSFPTQTVYYSDIDESHPEEDNKLIVCPQQVNRTIDFTQTNNNVGIGTSQPSEKLHVAGNIMADKIKIRSIELRQGINFPDNTIQTSAAKGDWTIYNESAVITTYKVTDELSFQNYMSNCSADGTSSRCSTCSSAAYQGGIFNLSSAQQGCPAFSVSDPPNPKRAQYTTRNVGIGTTDPQAKLEIKGDGGDNVDLIVSGRIKSNNDDGGFWVSSDRFIGGHSTNKVGFYNGGNWQLTVQNNGYTGIGTATPGEKLDVAGNIKITGIPKVNYLQFPDNTKQYTAAFNYWTKSGNNISYSSGSVTIDGLDNCNNALKFGPNNYCGYAQINTSGSALHIWGDGNGSNWDTRKVDVFSEGGGTWHGELHISDKWGNNQASATENDGYLFSVGSNALFRNDVVVKNLIQAKEFRMCVTPGDCPPDYVFDTQYDLMPIAEVKKYIEKNHHLPHIDAAKTMIEKGINIKEMNFALLRQMEELYLYTLQQDEKAEQLETKIKTQEAKDISLEEMVKKQQKDIEELKALVNQLKK